MVFYKYNIFYITDYCYVIEFYYPTHDGGVPEYNILNDNNIIYYFCMV